MLLASYSRKKTRKRKKGGKDNDNNGNKQQVNHKYDSFPCDSTEWNH